MKKIVMLWLLTGAIVTVQAQNRYEVVIDEIMADPSPPVGLPNLEWIELKNTGSSAINLQNWRIGDASSQSGAFPSFILLPDSFVIVCSSSSLSALSVFGRAVSVTSFPSLDNTGDLLYLKAATGKIIHGIEYDLSWYGNELKKDGGWSMEMSDTHVPCSGISNWKASTDPAGGTPGKKNATDGINAEHPVPVIKNVYTTGNNTISIVFENPVDSISATTISHYQPGNNIVIQSAICLPPLFNVVQLKTAQPLDSGHIYEIQITQVKDCSSNTMTETTVIRTGIPAAPHTGDVVINEILFNPRSGGYDFTELLNRSEKIIDAASLYIASRNSSGAIASLTPVTTTPFYLFPGDYLAITENATALGRDYFVKDPKAVIELSSLPSMPDDEGWVILLDAQGNLLEELHYKDDWHFKLMNDPEGVSLERVDPVLTVNDPLNWHSAASTAGWATPGYRNSQYKQQGTADATFSITPTVISPDNDGRDDMATIQYQMESSGFVANITIYDASGRPVRLLVRNALLGHTGYWRWDGLDENGQKLQPGPYIFFIEIFNGEGKRKVFKEMVVVAGTFK
ncbi:MAG: lamin tail domain-containing protein [Chitinophagaceae bacterium]|nr:lamin tail domain-containing protein [Chitinophagaceae bacterium]